VHDDDAAGPVADSAILWLEGFGPDSEFFASAIDADAFLVADGYAGGPVYGEPRAWPAAVEAPTPEGERGFRYSGRRLGVDVVRGCLVVELGDGNEHRVVISVSGAAAVVEIGRNASGQIDA
jgi:hypothetical protein